MLPTTLQTDIWDNILLVKLNRPEKRNAFNDELILGIETVFSNVPAGIGCAIIYGEGNHFSAGLDLSALTERDAVQGLHHSRMWHRALDRVQFGTVPVIAVLHGACVGGGLELASACHIRVAETTTFYALPEGQRGIFVGGGVGAGAEAHWPRPHDRYDDDRPGVRSRRRHEYWLIAVRGRTR
ncbi:enoyl-CoA hydratase-related protein [Spirosoma arcticum]